MKRYYQIDRYANEQAAFEGMSDMRYEMIKSTSRKQALLDYLAGIGNDISEYTIGKANVRDNIVVSASCPEDTTEIWTASVTR